MACCLTLAVLLAMVRRLAPGRRRIDEFAPPATRRAAILDPALHTAPRTAGATSRRAPVPARGREFALGLAVGFAAYFVDVIVLTLAGTVTASTAVHGSLAVAAATTSALLWRTAPTRGRGTGPALGDPALTLGIASLVFGAAGLLEMHVLHAISFTSPSLLSDVAFHGAGPLLALQAAVIQMGRSTPRAATAR